MPTAYLPERPDLEQLRRQARELQRAIRVGTGSALRDAGIDTADPTYSLHAAHRVLARRYGFSSWSRLSRHVQQISVRTWTHVPVTNEVSPASQFVRLACLGYADDDPQRWAQAADLLRQHPDIPAGSLSAAAACADVAQIRRILDEQRDVAAAPTGPYDWPALMYLTYSRIDVDRDAALRSAQLLLEMGADPNDGRFFDGLAMPFTVLTGCFGGGERDQPPHPQALPLARLLLSHGAEANDGQTLYNRMFGTNDDFLELLLEYGLGRGDGGPWPRLLPDLLPAPAELLGGLLQWAVLHDQRARVAVLAGHGVDVSAPLPGGGTALEQALRNGHVELAEQLREIGAIEPALDPVDRFVAAALAGDSTQVETTPRSVVDAARSARPGLIVWAAGQQRLDAVELLVAAGFDINAYARADLPVEQGWQTALHTAVERDHPQLVRRLLELGADPTLRDTRFDGTAADWAQHLGRPELSEILSGDTSLDPNV